MATMASPPAYMLYSPVPTSFFCSLTNMRVPPQTQLYSQPSPALQQQVATPKPKSNLIPAIIAAVVGLILLIAFFSICANILFLKCRTTATLPAPQPGSNDSLETAVNPREIALIAQLIAKAAQQGGVGLGGLPSKLNKPAPSSDIASVLDYLLKRGRNLDGHAWSQEAIRALGNRSNWKVKEGSPPKFIYAAGFDTPHPFLAFYSAQVGDWGLTSAVNAPIQ